MDIENTLQERENRYGEYKSVALVSQIIKTALVSGDNYESLSACQIESLHMIANKMARIVNGDANYPDSWHDIAGYATLIVKELSE